MHNPPSAQPTYKDKKAGLIYKRVCVLQLHIKHMCVHLIYVYIFMIQKLLLFLSVILFLPTLQYTVWPGSGATYTSGLETIRGHHALKHKYHLPLTPPPPLNFVLFVQIQVQICDYLVT